VDVAFVLDTIAPAMPTLDLDPSSQSTPGSDSTTFAAVTLNGQTDPNTSITLVESSQATTSDDAGRFSFSGVALELGENSFTVRASDAAGNQSEATRVITRVSADGARALQFDTDTTAAIANPGDTIKYSFTGTAGLMFALVPESDLSQATFTLA